MVRGNFKKPSPVKCYLCPPSYMIISKLSPSPKYSKSWAEIALTPSSTHTHPHTIQKRSDPSPNRLSNLWTCTEEVSSSSCLSNLRDHLFLACPWLVHNLFNTCSLVLNDLFMTCYLLLVNNLFINCLLFFHVLSIHCSQLVHNLPITCSWLVHNLIIIRSWQVRGLLMTFSELVHNLFT